MNSTAVNVAAARAEEIAACIDDARGMIAGGVNREALERVAERLLALAARRDLFTYDIYPVQDGDGASSIYLLAEDDDHGFAIFAVSEISGNMTPPHDHTTWAVIAGIEGAEVNRLYARDDDGSEPGRARIHETGEVSIGPGTAVAFMPDDIHSIHCFTDEPTLNFHLYGRGIEHLPERKMFNMKDGTCAVFPTNPKIHK